MSAGTVAAAQATPTWRGPGGVSAEPGTVLIAVHQGFAIRYLLRTDIFRTLRDRGARIVILAPTAGEQYFIDEFSAERVAVEPLDSEAYERYRLTSKLQVFLEFVRLFVLSNRGDLEAIWRRDIRERARINRPKWRLRWWLARPVVHALRRSRLLRRLLIAFETRVLTPSSHAHVFARYRPDLMVVASLGYWTHDAFLMREARRHGVPVASVILSWDNPSSKGLGGAEPDHVVTWSENMKREVVCYHDIPPERVFVGGVAHFDQHARAAQGGRRSRGEPRRQIVFAAASPTLYHQVNLQVVELIGRAIAEGGLAAPAQLLVRAHPLYLGRGLKRADSTKLDELRAVVARYPHVSLDIPETQSNRIGFDMPREDMAHLQRMLGAADLLVTVYSTIILEAAIFDVPVVIAGYAELKETIQDRYPHMRRAVDSGGTRVARNHAELLVHVNNYLARPHLDAEGRAAIRENECGPHPGHAGQAIGDYLFSLLPVKTQGAGIEVAS